MMTWCTIAAAQCIPMVGRAPANLDAALMFLKHCHKFDLIDERNDDVRVRVRS